MTKIVSSNLKLKMKDDEGINLIKDEFAVHLLLTNARFCGLKLTLCPRRSPPLASMSRVSRKPGIREVKSSGNITMILKEKLGYGSYIGAEMAEQKALGVA